MNLKETCTGSKLIYDGKIVKLFEDQIELPNGAPAHREYIKHVGAVCVLPLTDDKKVVLERQFRYPFGRVMVEIPAGKLNDSCEDPALAALRELREETGIVPQTLTHIGDFIGSPAILGERVSMFLARGLSFCEQQLDEDEFLEVFAMPLDEVVEKVISGEIADGKTQAAVLKTHILLQKEGKKQ